MERIARPGEGNHRATELLGEQGEISNGVAQLIAARRPDNPTRRSGGLASFPCADLLATALSQAGTEATTKAA